MNGLQIFNNPESQRSAGATLEIPNRDLIVNNESGLYSMLFVSKYTGLKKPKHWVTSEVVPFLRKTGKCTVSDAVGGMEVAA